MATGNAALSQLWIQLPCLGAKSQPCGNMLPKVHLAAAQSRGQPAPARRRRHTWCRSPCRCMSHIRMRAHARVQCGATIVVKHRAHAGDDLPESAVRLTVRYSIPSLAGVGCSGSWVAACLLNTHHARSEFRGTHQRRRSLTSSPELLGQQRSSESAGGGSGAGPAFALTSLPSPGSPPYSTTRSHEVSRFSTSADCRAAH